jgi:hypothetical protein
MSTKDIRQLVTTPTHAIVSDGIVEASNVGYRPLGDFKANLGLGTSLTQTANNGSGTAGTPAFAFVGDENTGIYRPGADALGFVTNGSEKVRINSAGNVGIGTTSPSEILDVNGVARINGFFINRKYNENAETITFNHGVTLGIAQFCVLLLAIARWENTASGHAEAHIVTLVGNSTSIQNTLLHSSSGAAATITRPTSGQLSVSGLGNAKQVCWSVLINV